MPISLFQYPLPADAELTDLNRFLRTHRVAGVQREFVVTAAGPLLVFIVEWIESPVADSPRDVAQKIDYREFFDDDQFALFSRLRDLRKSIAEAEGIPVYSVFSNAHLAAMVTNRCREVSDLQKIREIGKARIQKYGVAFMELLNQVPRTEDAATEGHSGGISASR
jgi:superfamily II DNA helicase RecQ